MFKGNGLKVLLNDSVVYGGALAVSKMMSLFTFPLLARHFSVSEYGILDFFIVLSGPFAVLFIFGQDSAIARYFYEHDDAKSRKQLISQSLTFQLVGLAVLLPVLWIGSDWITMHIIDVPERELLFKLVLVQMPFLILLNFSQNLLKWTFSRVRFLTISLGFTVVQACLLVIGVLVFDISVQGVLSISVANGIIFGALGLFFVREWLERPTSLNRIRDILPYAIPFGLIGITGAFSPTLERLLTNTMLGSEQLGLYAAAAKIAMLIGLFVTAFQTAWGPFSLSIHKQKGAIQIYNRVLKYFVVGICVLALTISLFAQSLINILASKSFGSAVIVVFPLVMGLSIQAISWITEIGISISKRSYLNIYSYTVSILSTLLWITILTPILGLLGVGLGVMLGHIAKALIASWLAQKAFPMYWQYKQVINLICITLIIGLSATLMKIELGQDYGNMMLALGVGIVALIGWFKVLDNYDRIKIKELVASRVSSRKIE